MVIIIGHTIKRPGSMIYWTCDASSKTINRHCIEPPCRGYSDLRSLWLTQCGPVTTYGDTATLAQVEACGLTAQSHHLNHYWHIISEVFLHSPDSNFKGSVDDRYHWYEFKKCNDILRLPLPGDSEIMPFITVIELLLGAEEWVFLHIHQHH